jgi:hypothetical protein
MVAVSTTVWPYTGAAGVAVAVTELAIAAAVTRGKPKTERIIKDHRQHHMQRRRNFTEQSLAACILPAYTALAAIE